MIGKIAVIFSCLLTNPAPQEGTDPNLRLFGNSPPVETARDSYETLYSRVQIEAICSYSGDIKCWDAKGNLNPEAEKLVKEAKEKSTTPIPTVQGKKNRLVLFKTTQLMKSRNPAIVPTSVLVQGAGKPLAIVYSNLNVSPGNSAETKYDIRVIADSPEAKVSSAVLSRMNPVNDSKIKLEIGSEAKFGEMGLKITDIKEGSLKKPRANLSAKLPKVWTVTLKSTGTLHPRAFVTYQSIAKDQSYVHVVDDQGNLVDIEKYRETVIKSGKKGGAKPEVIRPGSGIIDVNGDSFTLEMYANPTNVHSLLLGGHTVQLVRLVGIPMDPR